MHFADIKYILQMLHTGPPQICQIDKSKKLNFPSHLHWVPMIWKWKDPKGLRYLEEYYHFVSKSNLHPFVLGIILSGFPLGLENLEKWEGIFQSGKSQGILNRL